MCFPCSLIFFLILSHHMNPAIFKFNFFFLNQRTECSKCILCPLKASVPLCLLKSPLTEDCSLGMWGWDCRNPGGWQLPAGCSYTAPMWQIPVCFNCCPNIFFSKKPTHSRAAVSEWAPCGALREWVGFGEPTMLLPSLPPTVRGMHRGMNENVEI